MDANALLPERPLGDVACPMRGDPAPATLFAMLAPASHCLRSPGASSSSFSLDLLRLVLRLPDLGDDTDWLLDKLLLFMGERTFSELEVRPTSAFIFMGIEGVRSSDLLFSDV